MLPIPNFSVQDCALLSKYKEKENRISFNAVPTEDAAQLRGIRTRLQTLAKIAALKNEDPRQFDPLGSIPAPPRRLFVDDAKQGLGLLETAEKKFDVVLMNPPFGAGSAKAKKEFEKAYPRTKNDVYAAFVERGIELLRAKGRLGATTSRTGFFLSSFQKWREEILLKTAPPVVFADLGAGVRSRRNR